MEIKFQESDYNNLAAEILNLVLQLQQKLIKSSAERLKIKARTTSPRKIRYSYRSPMLGQLNTSISLCLLTTKILQIHKDA